MENNPGATGTPTRRGADGRRYSSTRERILREVESRGSAVSTADVVEATGLHENTVREHLERLRLDGRLRRVRAEVQGRGRPGWLWQAPPADAVSPYAGLALALADTLTQVTHHPAAAARESGVRWGREIVAQHPDATATGPALVAEVMREQGFAPEPSGDEPNALVLRSCPLLAAAARRSDVVCAVHEGMIEGILRSRPGDEAQRTDAALLPFRADGACLLHLRAAS